MKMRDSACFPLSPVSADWGRRYFLITPKLLTNLRYHERMKVLVINNGEIILPHIATLLTVLVCRHMAYVPSPELGKKMAADGSNQYPTPSTRACGMAISNHVSLATRAMMYWHISCLPSSMSLFLGSLESLLTISVHHRLNSFPPYVHYFMMDVLHHYLSKTRPCTL